ncbi:hypothetical protein WP3W18E01_04420 [Raoultella ornithinolytica]|nr:hypothetical protein HMPREF9690_04410 [Raoultella ornithinolytica 10-5246]QDI06655.1 hypothetical protein electrica_00408 [Klebsiella electrica]CAE6310728.1 hypothetical protein AI2711V1_0442 [Raoultella ornithinolytica]BBV74337.1 hypothetical protein STW0522RAO56_03910 [Raoultella planticola]CAH3345164.1 hypothetical protein AI2711V1_0442 [Raoultella ornithinolytica]
MRDRSHISNISDAETSGVQCTNGRFATRTRTFDHNFQILDAVFFYGFSATLCCNLSCKRSGFARTTETGTTGCCPTQCVTLTIGNGNDGVVKRSMDMSHAIRDLFSYTLTCTNWCLCHYSITPIIS